VGPVSAGALRSKLALLGARWKQIAVAAAACTPTQFSPGNSPVWDGQVGDLGTFLLSEVFWVFSVLGDFILNIFGSLFGGIGCLVWSVFTAPGIFLQTSWNIAVGYLAFAGPFAPILAIAIVGLTIVVLVWFVDFLIREFLIGGEETEEAIVEEAE
jgi:hypothetical protein